MSNKASFMVGLRTTIYMVTDIKKATEWYSEAFFVKPYFNEPFYVGFNIKGYELGLQQEERDSSTKTENVFSYWGVEDINKAYQHFIDIGATKHEAPNDVGGDIMVASLYDPWNNIIGLIYNPHFKVEE
ncbi:VOC family protein [Pontimicrobium sp. MEBiC01747]